MKPAGFESNVESGFKIEGERGFDHPSLVARVFTQYLLWIKIAHVMH